MSERADYIYLDHAATTPVDPDVVQAMCGYLGPEGVFANPASATHAGGWAAAEAVERARAEVAALINARPQEIVWTSGATEADNLAIKGAAESYCRRGSHIVTARTEHKAVLDSCRRLERAGYRVTYLRPGRDGLIEPAQLEAALEADTILVSLMHVNNETGVVQDIDAFARITRKRGIILHVDAAQSAGKLAIDAHRLGADLISLSAHKMYGPKGVGALYVRHRPRVRLSAQMHGGGHEQGLRSGTLPTHQIVGMGHACRLARGRLAEDSERMARLRRRLEERLCAMPGVLVNGDRERRAPHIASLTFQGVDGEALMAALTRPSARSALRLAVSSGSACTTASREPSYVLRALGRSDAEAEASLRLSVGRSTCADEIDAAAERVRASVERLRALSPRWTQATAQRGPAAAEA